jgi:hypothetical protein
LPTGEMVRVLCVTRAGNLGDASRSGRQPAALHATQPGRQEFWYTYTIILWGEAVLCRDAAFGDVPVLAENRRSR